MLSHLAPARLQGREEQVTHGKKDDYATGDNDFLHDLELTVTEELTVAESPPLGEESDSAPAVEWLLDVDAQRYEVSLRILLGAIEAAEDDTA